MAVKSKTRGPFLQWLLAGHVKEPEGPHEPERAHRPHTWPRVMCLTGVDYFSTLGYQPGIAALVAGALSPLATFVLVLLTLFGALPIYKKVAQESPHGDGSIAMLEELLSYWTGKLFVLALLGFVATDFIITITLSAADATEHIVENPLLQGSLHGWEVGLTLVLVALLGAVFLKGFKEAIGLAVVLVIAFLGMNAIVITRGLIEIYTHPVEITNWWQTLTESRGNNFLLLAAAALLAFPRLALGLSGFETGVAVMPLVKGDPGESHKKPAGRIRNAQKLLSSAAIIMSVFLLSSSLVTTMHIPAAEFAEATATSPAGKANGRALAYLAHEFFGTAFGTAYDLSTIFILWFAGASAMAGLLNIVPRFLPRYGMAPEWTKANRPLVIVFTAVAFAVTIIFKADVNAQGGAYATGVLVLMTSAAIAVTLAFRKERKMKAMVYFFVVSLIFIYTTLVNVYERPDGIKIASFFILSIVGVSLVSRIWRMLELRVERVEVSVKALKLIEEATGEDGIIRIIPNKPSASDDVYGDEEREARADHGIPAGEKVIFFEVFVSDPSDFSGVLQVDGRRFGDHLVLRAKGTAVPNTIAAFLLWLRDKTGRRPHAYLNWTEGNPIGYLLKYLLFGVGETAPLTREILRRQESNPKERPVVHTS
jgi:hypothetical protein